MKTAKMLSLGLLFAIYGNYVAAEIDIAKTNFNTEIPVIEDEKIKQNIDLASALIDAYRKGTEKLTKDQIEEKLKSVKIYANLLYNQAAVDESWAANQWWGDLGKHVVRINLLEKGEEKLIPFIGTGTLIDLGIESLKGKVVVTCLHCVGPYNEENIIFPENFYFNSKDGENGFFEIPVTNSHYSCYISVTHELNNNIKTPILRTRDDLANTSFNHNKVSKMYVSEANGDVAILILEEPIKDSGGNTLSGESITEENIGKLRGGGDSVKQSTDDNRTIIGYGLTAFESGVIPFNLFGVPSDYIDNTVLLDKRYDLMGLLGWGIKKTANLKDLRAVRAGNNYKIDGPIAGGGFSGSLIVTRNSEEKKEYLGIYSGPAFHIENTNEYPEETEYTEPQPFLIFLNYVKEQELELELEQGQEQKQGQGQGQELEQGQKQGQGQGQEQTIKFLPKELSSSLNTQRKKSEKHSFSPLRRTSSVHK
jgi:hypothetical protein